MNQPSNDLRTIERFRGYIAFVILCATFMFCTLFAMFAGQAAAQLFDDKSISLTVNAAFNTLIMFGLPGFIMCWWLKKTPREFLGLRSPKVGENGSKIGAFFWAIFLLLIGMAALNQIIYWNANIPVPNEGIWLSFRQMEDAAAATTSEMLSSTSVGALIAYICVVGLLTGFCEELFFRATLQKTLLMTGLGKHAAIWISALIFSALHFQFFGFIPRLLLGAFFGYLMYATGSVWVSSAVHAFNNSLVVLFTWLANRGVDLGEVDEFGVSTDGFPATALASLICFFVVCRMLKRRKILNL